MMRIQYTKGVTLLKALADANRLMIVDMLSGGELCACRILERFKITQPTLSHHMKILCGCGLVIGRKSGKWTYYSLDAAKVQECETILREVTKCKESKCCKDAAAYFNDGFNCAQAILSAYCTEFGLDQKTALKIACGLGAGMGRRQETCGAVSGAYLVIGLKYGTKEKTYAMVREFARRFEERNKSTNCRALLGVDLISGDKRVAAERVKQVCPQVVRDAAEILETILNLQEE